MYWKRACIMHAFISNIGWIQWEISMMFRREFFRRWFQGLVNVPWLGDFEHHLKKYLLEIISYYIPNIWVMWKKNGHLPSPVKTGHRWQEWANQMDIHRIIHSNSLGAVITQSPLTGDILEYAENPTLANHAEAREHIHSFMGAMIMKSVWNPYSAGPSSISQIIGLWV